jgi:ABC-2 type transport system permease protein
LTHAAVTVACVAALCGLTLGGTAAGIHTMSVKEDLPPPSVTIPLVGVRIPLSLREPEKIRIPMREKTKVSYFFPGAFNLFCLGVALAGFSSLISALDRYRWRTIGVIVGAFVLSLVLKLLGQAIPEVSWLQYFSLFTAYEPQKFVSIAVHDPQHLWSLALYDANQRFVELGPLGYNLVMVFVGLASYLGAGVIFQRRDLPAPL